MKRLICAAFAVLLVFSLCACKSEPPRGYPVEAGSVTFSKTPEKVVALSSSIVQELSVLGFSGRLVGVGDGVSRPEAASQLPKCGTALTPDADKMIKLGADLVLTPAKLPASALDKLSAAGINVLVVPHAQTLDSALGTLSALAAVFAGSETGPLIAEDVKFLAETVLSYLSEHVPEDTSAAILLRLPHTAATGDTWLGDMLTRAGFINAAEDGEGWVLKPDETTAADIIFRDGAVSDEALSKSAWANTAAFKNGRVITLDTNLLEAQSPAAFLEFLKAVQEALPDADWGDLPSLTVERVIEVPEKSLLDKIKELFS